MGMDPSTRPSTNGVSANWQFKKRPSGRDRDREDKSFITTVREEFREDTETWFGTEAVSSESGSSMTVSTVELGSYGGGGREMEHRVRVIGGGGYGEASHLDMDM